MADIPAQGHDPSGIPPDRSVARASQ